MPKSTPARANMRADSPSPRQLAALSPRRSRARPLPRGPEWARRGARRRIHLPQLRARACARRQATRPLRRRGSPRSPPGRHPARHSIDRFPGNCRPQRGGPRTSRERSSPTTSGDGARHRRRRGRAPAQQTATATTRPHARGTGRRRVGWDDAAWDGTVIEATGPRIAQTGRTCVRARRDAYRQRVPRREGRPRPPARPADPGLTSNRPRTCERRGLASTPPRGYRAPWAADRPGAGARRAGGQVAIAHQIARSTRGEGRRHLWRLPSRISGTKEEEHEDVDASGGRL